MDTITKNDISMDAITAAQAAEEAKGLTFEMVWAALMEYRRQMTEDAQKREEERLAEAQKREEERQKREEERLAEAKKREEERQKRDEEWQKRGQELREQTEKYIQESQKRMEASQKESQKKIDAMTKSVGEISNSFGRLTESLFSTGLCKKFNELGYPFSKQGPHLQFIDNSSGKVLAEADYFLEDGEYAMAVEVKTDLKVDDVKDHMERLAVIRKLFDERGDKRILVGAVAGGIVRENVVIYAQRQGLYVIMQSGDSAVIADAPEGFKAREW